MHSPRHLNSSQQIGILAPLAGTPAYSKYREQMILEELCSDTSHQGRIQNAADRNLIRTLPHIFPNFYLPPAPGLDRASFPDLREFLPMASGRLRWLLVALHRHTGELTAFELWRRRREALHPGLSGWSMRRYYMQETSRNEFVQFADELVQFGDARFADSSEAQGPPGAPPEIGGTHPFSRDPAAMTCACPSEDAVRSLIGYQKALIDAGAGVVSIPEGKQLSGGILRDSIPVRRHGLRILELGWDIQESSIL